MYKNIEKVILATLLILSLYELYCIYEQIAGVPFSKLFLDSLFVLKFFMVTVIIPLLISVSWLIGVAIILKQRKFMFNNWIKIPLYYLIVHTLVIDFFVYYKNYDSIPVFLVCCIALRYILLLSCVICWLKYHKPTLSKEKMVSSNKKLRLLHHLVDWVCVYVISINAHTLLFINYEINVFYLILFTVWFVYYFVLELIFGQTIGKAITNTAVYSEDKNRVKVIFIRTISRFIPFEPLSFILGHGFGWHDTLSKSEVVKI